ncbi:MAG: isopenicillin N synthase-like dioxygenase [Gammaproteobacteria bacterium]
MRTRDGEWFSALAIDDTFVVNIGDLMMRWANDRWRSRPHRVAVPPADARERSRRLSIGFFVVPNDDTQVECVDQPGVAPKYPHVSVRDYRSNRFAAGAGLTD